MVIPALLVPGATVSVHADEPVEIVVAAAGDIACRPGESASSTHCRQAATAAVIGTINPTYVLAPGDNQYETGTLTEYNGAYHPTWGAYRDKTLPVPGNHEYDSSGAAGYYNYFGARAGAPTKGYYSLNAGSWHIVALNSECSPVDGCHTGSPQEHGCEPTLPPAPRRHRPQRAGGSPGRPCSRSRGRPSRSRPSPPTCRT